MKTPDELDDMYSALLEVRKEIVGRTGTYEGASDGHAEVLTFVSTAEINLLAWVMGLGDSQNDFIDLGVCEQCGNRGWFWTELSGKYTQVTCGCKTNTESVAN